MNLTGLSNFIQQNVLSVVLLVVGVIVLARSSRGDHKGAMVTIGIVMLGLFVLGLATGGRAVGVGQWLSGLVLG